MLVAVLLRRSDFERSAKCGEATQGTDWGGSDQVFRGVFGGVKYVVNKS